MAPATPPAAGKGPEARSGQAVEQDRQQPCEYQPVEGQQAQRLPGQGITGCLIGNAVIVRTFHGLSQQ